MQKKLVIAKLGGSAITHKSKFESANLPLITRLARGIGSIPKARAMGAAPEKSIEDKTPALILIHGAGSYGHFQARQYKLSSSGAADHADWMQGLCETRNRSH